MKFAKREYRIISDNEFIDNTISIEAPKETNSIRISISNGGRGKNRISTSIDLPYRVALALRDNLNLYLDE